MANRKKNVFFGFYFLFAISIGIVLIVFFINIRNSKSEELANSLTDVIKQKFSWEDLPKLLKDNSFDYYGTFINMNFSVTGRYELSDCVKIKSLNDIDINFESKNNVEFLPCANQKELSKVDKETARQIYLTYIEYVDEIGTFFTVENNSEKFITVNFKLPGRYRLSYHNGKWIRNP